MSLRSSTEIKRAALALGFAACGIARAERVGREEEERLRSWLAAGGHADMSWLENHLDLRLDPRLVLDGTRSIVSVALSYAPARRLPEGELQMAAYALGQDYHEVVRQRLHRLAAEIYGSPEQAVGHYRAFADSGPVLERYWAQQAGIGWVGRNQLLIIPGAGSMFFLGELLIDFETEYDAPMPNRCGRCRRCVDHCPTHALSVDGLFVSERCLSYQTIEHRGPLSEPVRQAMGDCFYGCDRCQEACPWNKKARPTTVAEFQPRPELLAMTRERWAQLAEDDYRRLFKGSAVKRAKYEGVRRNIAAVLDKRREAEPPTQDAQEQ